MKKSNLFKKLALAGLVCATAVTATSCGNKAPKREEAHVGNYTYKTNTEALGTNWNPHTWEMNADSSILGYLSDGITNLSVLSSEDQTWQWIYDASTSVTDVTKDHTDDLVKYGVKTAQEASSIEQDYVYEIKLREGVKWENGDIINADTYLYSMAQLLDPHMKNYRSNTYWNGDGAIAGGKKYYNSDSPIYTLVVEPAETLDYSRDLTGKDLYINLKNVSDSRFEDSFADIMGLVKNPSDELKAAYKAFEEGANAYGYTKVSLNDAKLRTLVEAYVGVYKAYNIVPADLVVTADVIKEFLYFGNGKSAALNFNDTVGLYKVDDYTIRYVTQNAYPIDSFKTSMTSNFIVHEATYEAAKDKTGELITSKYGTSKETTMSFGPYKIGSLQNGKQIKFVRNEYWWGYEKTKDGQLVSFTDFVVDGKYVQQYQANEIVIDVMDNATAKQAFLKGEQDDWTPTASELSSYTTSDNLYRVDETYTMRLFFNDNLDALKTMDASKGNKNSVILSNVNVRNAMSLAIDRAEWVTATEGYKPAYSLINKLYYYDIYNDPTSVFRNQDDAKKTICELYGVEYGKGKPYADLDEAYESITGKDMSSAQALMKKACDELVAAGLYTKGQDIKIKLAWKAGAPNSDDQKQVTLLQKYWNEACQDSGFGTITLELVGNLQKRYEDVPAGEYAIGFGAWGGAAFYPFNMMRNYFDPSYTKLHEGGSWNPSSEKLTLKIDGKDVVKTYQQWANVFVGEGDYANASNEVKVYILAQLEKAFLEKYHAIPLASTTACFLMSHKLKYYTEDYNIMYDFGGLRLAKFQYTDEEWNQFVKEQGGSLNYK